ncbi:hypothetical protein QBC46DRAFT_72296 [Diplogelasinospora grovesii]|uniref:Uncharacterized protein n=1 Tax=Diplogelasinospora grovesii TaxID=303347 RepID=A0AAN6ND13_9PEZI|nr:hypothetical protein QBC46DRAFT_72296 [Diplogelasinospora grovesii]
MTPLSPWLRRTMIFGSTLTIPAISMSIYTPASTPITSTPTTTTTSIGRMTAARSGERPVGVAKPTRAGRLPKPSQRLLSSLD